MKKVLPILLATTGMALANVLPPENAFISFGNDSFAPGGLECDLELIDKLADAGYTVITHTLRCRPDLNSPETKAACKAIFERAHKRGLKVYMDTDPRIARHAYLEKHPDRKQGILRFGVVAATNGEARVEIVQRAIDDHMSWGSKRPYEAVASKFVKAWAIRPAGKGEVAARVIDAKVTAEKPDRMTVSASGLKADESLAALVRFDLWSIDIFAPDLLEYERKLMAEYKALGADGGMRDEWGFPPSSVPGLKEHRSFWYSDCYAQVYAKATGGRILADDALLFAFPLSGRAAERSQAILAYMRLNYERNTEIECDFYETDKKLFGPDVYVCKHPTWYPVIGWHEFLHDGLDWWSAKRDWAQTDEVTPVPAACGMAKKFGGSTWMNEGYQDVVDRYAPMIWRYALAGGRMVFHPVYPDSAGHYKKMKPREARIARHVDVVKNSKRARECVRLLSRISDAQIDCPVAFVFGHRRVAWDWSDSAYGDWGNKAVYGLWKQGWGVDLYPSTEFASFAVDADGWLTMGRQRYAALVTHNLDDQDRAALKALVAKGVTKTRLFEKTDGVAEYLRSVKGLARQTPCDYHGQQNWAEVLPVPDGTITLTDGTRARMKAVQSPEGDPIAGVLELAGGRCYKYAARGIFAANAKFVAGAGVTQIKGPGIDFTSPTPQDVVLPLKLAKVTVVDCPKCDKAARFADDGKSATVNRAKFKTEAEVAAAVKRAEAVLAANAVPDASVRPLMGWSSWNCFGLDINEEKIVAQAAAMATNGLKAAGYLYINTDDGFFDGHDAQGNLKWNLKRFPKGMKPVADGIHAWGLKAGIYSDAGEDMCGGSKGSGLYGHDAADCKLHFLDLGFDYIKVDYCGGCKLKLNEEKRYTEISKAIRATGRKDVKLNVCRWTYPGTWISGVADSWRVTGDIRANWKSIRQIVLLGLPLSAYASTGHYNDLDMLEVGHARGAKPTFDGDRELSLQEETAHFGLWCIMSSPLVLGCDLRTMPREAHELVTNPYLIAMNANALGLQAYPVRMDEEVVTLVKDAGERYGLSRYVALVNLGDEPAKAKLNLADIDLGGRAFVVDLVEKAEIGSFEATMQLTLKPHEAKFYRVFAERRIDRSVYRADSAWMRKFHKLSWAGDAPLYREVKPGAGEDWDRVIAATGLGRSAENDLHWRDVRVTKAGERELTFTVLASEPQSFSVSVDGGKAVELKVPAARWTQEVKCRLPFTAGAHDVRVFNEKGAVPGIVKMALK